MGVRCTGGRLLFDRRSTAGGKNYFLQNHLEYSNSTSRQNPHCILWHLLFSEGSHQKDNLREEELTATVMVCGWSTHKIQTDRNPQPTPRSSASVAKATLKC